MRVPCQAKKQLGRQEWLSMETAGHMPRPRSMLLLLATPVPCALLFTRAAIACAAHIPHFSSSTRSSAGAQCCCICKMWQTA